MVARVWGAVPIGVEAALIEVEVDVNPRGLPGFVIVGLPSKAVDEARERVKAAIKNAGFEFVNKRITVNLAPADLPKEGTVLDLPIAVGILVLSGQLPAQITEKRVFYGELSLSGELRRCPGVVLAAATAVREGMSVCVPQANLGEASLVPDICCWPIANLRQLALGVNLMSALRGVSGGGFESEVRMCDVRGQRVAKRAAVVAVAGGHNLLLSGSPGVGKTMIARAMRGLLPPLGDLEYLEVVSVYSGANMMEELRGRFRPFRAPHHTLSTVGLIGGGTRLRPGEVTLAHRGMLFLDELPLFSRVSLEAMRQPMEDKKVAIVRAGFRVILPCDFMLVAAVNPCPCGYLNHLKKACSCTPMAVERYRQRISGPVIDRIDMIVRLSEETTAMSRVDEDNADGVIAQARERQMARNRGKTNALLDNRELERCCELEAAALRFLERTVALGQWSHRARYRALRVARTIADIDGKSKISLTHLSEAAMYRVPEW